MPKNINEISSRLEALEKLCKNLHSEKHMEAKVDYSALYPYFDSLANEEPTIRHISTPFYVKQQLQNIHALFEGVFDLTLGEVKTLYFERKSKLEVSSKKEDDEFITKKAKELCLGDRVVVSTDNDYGNRAETVTKLMNVFPEKVRFDWEDGYALFDLEAEVRILKE
jgi:hypothetical protein